MTSACDRCAKTIKRTDEVITCMGFCDHVVHLRCGSIDKTLNDSISDLPNLHWMCDECTKLVKIARFRKTVSSLGHTITELTKYQETANAELKSVLAKHSEQIAELSNRINVATPSLPASATSVNRRATKRRRTENDKPTVKPLIGGTKSSVDIGIATVQPPKPMFWIYLSRLHPSVKSESVEKLTMDCLNCDSAKAIPLIKKGTDVNSLNFISFKVGVDPKYRAIAVDPSSWPKGILFREFEDNRAQSYWMPEPSTPSIAITSDSAETPQHVTASMDTEEC